jgi:hypothetical protein
VEHVASGTDLFRVICDRDMEGIVAKQANARYTPEATTWVKIKRGPSRQRSCRTPEPSTASGWICGAASFRYLSASCALLALSEPTSSFCGKAVHEAIEYASSS